MPFANVPSAPVLSADCHNMRREKCHQLDCHIFTGIYMSTPQREVLSQVAQVINCKLFKKVCCSLYRYIVH